MKIMSMKIMSMKLFWGFFLFVLPVYAMFDSRFPFLVDKNVRIISDSNKLGVVIKIDKNKNKFTYLIQIFEFNNMEKLKNISFDDMSYYETCYLPKKGDYIIFASSPASVASVIAVNIKSGKVIKCCLDEYFKKFNIYTERDISEDGNVISVNFWHENKWRTLSEDTIFLPCEYEGKWKYSLAIHPKEGVVYLLPNKDKIRFKQLKTSL